MNEPWLLVCLLFPTLAGSLLFLNDKRPNVRDGISLTVSVMLTLSLIPIYQAVFPGEAPSFTIAYPVEGVPIKLKVDALGLLFATIASGLWILTTVYAIGYMRAEKDQYQTRFFFCFALSISAAIGIAFSDNMLTLFFFYEILTMATYPLVTHKGDEKALKGGRIYLGVLLTTSVGLMITAMIWTYILTGTLDFKAGGILAGNAEGWVVPILLALYIFGIGKAALMPVHKWLPNAMVAPTPVSALLHAVAVVKAGVFTVVKVVLYIFGTDLLLATNAAEWLIYIACFTIVVSSIVAVQQDSIKARLAYSTIGQLAYVSLGALLATDAAITGAVLQIAAHAVGKITLFFCAGAIYAAHHLTNVSQLDGMGRKMPFTFAAFALGAVSITGLPPMVGAWPKWYLISGAIDAACWIAVISLALSSLLNVWYLLGIVGRAYFAEPVTDIARRPGIEEAPMMSVVPLVITASLTVFFFFNIELLAGFIAAME